MNIRTLQRDSNTVVGRGGTPDLSCIRERGLFFVLSFALSKARRGSGYFNLVDKAAVDYVHERVGGTRGVTANHVLAAARRTKHIPTRLLALMSCTSWSRCTGQPSRVRRTPATVLFRAQGATQGPA